MIKQSTYIYTNFKAPEFPTKTCKRIRTLIMGHCGNGKTSFLNKMCGKNYKTGISRGSLTRDIVFEDSCYLPEGVLRIYDTPGTNSRKQALMHALILRRSIQALPLNLILIQAKFTSRFEQQTLTQFKQQVKIFKGYEKNIIFMVSNIDMLDQQTPQQKQRILEDIGLALKELGIKQKVILYSNLKTDFKQLTRILYIIGYDNEQVQIKIDDEKFYKYFRLSQINIKLVNQQIQKYISYIKQAADAYINYLQSVPINEPNIDDLISQLKIQMKYDLKQIQNQQYSKYEKDMDMHQSADLYLLISQVVYGKLQQLDLLSQAKLKKQYYFQIKDKILDLRDLFKKCPHCGLIWMRVQGCEGETSCGGKPQQFDVHHHKQLWKYDFKRDGSKLVKSMKQNSNVTQQQIDQVFKQRKEKEKSQSKGCKKLFTWNVQPRIENIQEMLKQMYGVGKYQEIQWDYQKMMLIRSEQLEKLNEKLESVEAALKLSLKQQQNKQKVQKKQ